jgi:hypothetical protein
MLDAAPRAELLRSLGGLVRGLSALFWGLPTALIVCFYTARIEGFKSFGVLPPVVCTGWLVFGLWELGAFQRQERIWRHALDRAQILGLVNFGLSPFLFWASRVPAIGFFVAMETLLAVCGLLFLGSLNLVLQRLGAMLPDEALRVEISQFTSLNLNLLFTMLGLSLLYLGLNHFSATVLWLRPLMAALDRANFYWILIPLVLLPLAMTMALLWKTKAVLFESVFGAKP